MDAASLRRELLGVLLALTVVGAVLSLALDAENSRRVTAVALEADDVVAVCRGSSYPLADFWDRAKAIGVSAVVMRDKPVSYLADRGEVLIFSRQELEKWRATGFLAPGAPLKANTIWTKDDVVFEQIEDEAARRGIELSTSASNGYRVAEFREGLDPSLPAGLDPDELASLSGRPLAVVRAESEGPAPVGFLWRAGGRVEGLSPADASAELVLEPETIAVDAERGRWLRAAFSDPRRLLVARLRLDAGVEQNFDLLRAAVKRLSAQGLTLSLPEAAPARRAELPWRASLRLLAGWLLGVLGPLFAARAGLLALKRARGAVLVHWPIASPIAQLVAGLLATVVAATGFGLAARLSFDAGQTLPPASWNFWTLAGPLLIGVMTLYAIDLEMWAEKLRRPLTGGTVLKAAAVVAGAAMILAPRAAARLAGGAVPWEIPGSAWWLSWRWREIVVGVPCFVQALVLIDWRVGCPDCELEKGPWADPRGWFLLGILWPIGIVSALCRGGAPVELTISQTAVAMLAGTLIGVAGIAARIRLAHGSKVLRHHRTIVPEGKV